jgi:hypothetical protein
MMPAIEVEAEGRQSSPAPSPLTRHAERRQSIAYLALWSHSRIQTAKADIDEPWPTPDTQAFQSLDTSLQIRRF